MRSLLDDARFGFRSLWRTPGVTIAALACLIMGIAVNTAIFSVLNGVLWRSLPLPEPDRVVTVWDQRDDGSRMNIGYETMLDVQRRATTLEAVAAIRTWSPRATGPEGAERLQGVAVSHEFFDVLGVQPALGRAFTADEDRPGHDSFVVLSHDLFARRFNADPGIIGQPVTLNGAQCVVLGVMPETFEPVISGTLYDEADLWAPLGYAEGDDSSCRGCRHLRMVARLAPGVSLTQAEQELTTIGSDLQATFPDDYAEAGMLVEGLQAHLVADVRSTLYVLFGAVGFIMLIACANVANLLLTRSNLRRREFALRAALGAMRWRIAQQLFVEGAVLGLIAAVGGLAVSIWAIDGLLALAPESIPRLDSVTMDARVLTFTMGLAILTGVMFSLAPALDAIRADVMGVLKQEGRNTASGSRQNTRRALVISEIALAIVLIVGGGLFLRSFARMSAIDPGFNPDNLLSFTLMAPFSDYPEDEARIAFYEEIDRRIEALPGVEAVTRVSTLPFGGSFDTIGMMDLAGDVVDRADTPSPDRYAVDREYFATMGIPLLSGRLFDESDGPDAADVVVVNQTLARRIWPNAEPLGQRVRLGGGPDAPVRTVVGVVADTLHHGFEGEATMQIYLPHAQHATSFMQLVVRADREPLALLNTIRREVWAINSAVPVQDPSIMTDLLASSVGARKFSMTLVGLFAAVAVLLAGLGLYAVIAFGVTQRAREIGIRIALGAARRDIVRLVMWEGLALAGAGVVVGLLGAWVLARGVSGLLYDITPGDPLTYALSGAVVLLVACAASFLPALRAGSFDPSVTLRNE